MLSKDRFLWRPGCYRFVYYSLFTLVLYFLWRGGRKFSETLRTFKLLSTKSFFVFVTFWVNPASLLDRLDNLSFYLRGDKLFSYLLNPF